MDVWGRKLLGHPPPPKEKALGVSGMFLLHYFPKGGPSAWGLSTVARRVVPLLQVRRTVCRFYRTST